MSKGEVVWALVLVALNIISYLIGLAKDKWGLPKPIARLLANKAVMELIRKGVDAAATASDKTDSERREYVHSWAKTELYELLGDMVPDSVINFLIEKIVADKKAANL